MDVGNNPAEEVQMARRERRKFSGEYKAEVVALAGVSNAPSSPKDSPGGLAFSYPADLARHR